MSFRLQVLRWNKKGKDRLHWYRCWRQVRYGGRPEVIHILWVEGWHGPGVLRLYLDAFLLVSQGQFEARLKDSSLDSGWLEPVPCLYAPGYLTGQRRCRPAAVL